MGEAQFTCDWWLASLMVTALFLSECASQRWAIRLPKGRKESPVWSSHWNAALCLMLWWNGRAKWPNPAFAFDLVSAKPDVSITFFFFYLRQNCVWGNVFPEKPHKGPTCISCLCWGGWWGFKALLGEILLTGRLGHWEMAPCFPLALWRGICPARPV